MNTAFIRVALRNNFLITTKYKPVLKRRFVIGFFVALLVLLLACSSAIATPVPTTSPALVPTSPIETKSDLGVLDTATANLMAELTDLINATQSEAGEEVAFTRGISGDFASFQNSVVPFLMFYGDDLTQIHSDRDTIEFVQPELL